MYSPTSETEVSTVISPEALSSKKYWGYMNLERDTIKVVRYIV